MVLFKKIALGQLMLKICPKAIYFNPFCSWIKKEFKKKFKPRTLGL
jgi:hypothetical protein